MILRNRIIAACLSLMAIFSILPIFNVAAQTTVISNQQVELIRSNCVPARNTLKQLHASDALLRVNMGQIYESMLTKLMVRFNSRAASNNLGSASLIQAANNFSQSLNDFRTSYKSYEEQLSIALSIDCFDQPVHFFEAISISRIRRGQVHDNVVKIVQYTDEYQSALEKFEDDFEKSSSGGVQ